ncbi:MAG: hypothetical protein AAF384_16465 [Pseudomonadota bacterium]
MKIPFRLLIAIAALCASLAAHALTYDEFFDGDLSDDPNAPTALSFDLGVNTIIAATDTIFGDPDYLTFTLAPGQTLVSIELIDFFTLSGFEQSAFFGIGDTTSWFSGPFNFNPAIQPSGGLEPTANHLISGFLFGDAEGGTFGTNLLDLPTLTGSSLGQLGAGTYFFWFNETSDEDTFELALTVTGAPVPIPAAAWLFVGGLPMLLAAGRRHPVGRIV